MRREKNIYQKIEKLAKKLTAFEQDRASKPPYVITYIDSNRVLKSFKLDRCDNIDDRFKIEVATVLELLKIAFYKKNEQSLHNAKNIFKTLVRDFSEFEKARINEYHRLQKQADDRGAKNDSKDE